MLKNQDLARLMHEQYPEYLTYEYKDMISIFTALLCELALQGEVLQLKNFGTFYPKVTKARQVFDPQSLQYKETSGNIILKFKPARSLQDKIKEVVMSERAEKTKGKD